YSQDWEEDGNTACDTCTESLRLFEVVTFFKSLTFGGFLSAALGNADAADTGFAADLLIVRAIETTIGGEDFGSGTECFPVILQRGLHVVFIGGIHIQDAVLS